MQRDMFCSVLFCSVLFCSEITVSFYNLNRNYKAYSLCECIGNVPFFCFKTNNIGGRK